MIISFLAKWYPENPFWDPQIPVSWSRGRKGLPQAYFKSKFHHFFNFPIFLNPKIVESGPMELRNEFVGCQWPRNDLMIVLHGFLMPVCGQPRGRRNMHAPLAHGHHPAGWPHTFTESLCKVMIKSFWTNWHPENPFLGSVGLYLMVFGLKWWSHASFASKFRQIIFLHLIQPKHGLIGPNQAQKRILRVLIS